MTTSNIVDLAASSLTWFFNPPAASKSPAVTRRVLRLRKPGFDQLAPCNPPPIDLSVTKEFADYRAAIMAYDKSRISKGDMLKHWESLLRSRKDLYAGVMVLTRGERELPVWMICHRNHVRAVMSRIRRMANDDLYTNPDHQFYRCFCRNLEIDEPCGWIDIDNGFMWFTDAKMFADVSKLLNIGVLV